MKRCQKKSTVTVKDDRKLFVDNIQTKSDNKEGEMLEI